MKNLLLALFLVCAASALKMTLTLEDEETVCFYQMLSTVFTITAAHQKYALEATPLSKGRYEVLVKHMQDNQWQHSVYRDTE